MTIKRRALTRGMRIATPGAPHFLGGAPLAVAVVGASTLRGAGVATTTGVAASAQALVPAGALTPPTSSSRVSASANRFLAGSGPTLCAMGFPLPPAFLTPSQLAAGYGRPMLGGVEEPAFVEAPIGPGALHPDGSLRLVYVQMQPTLTFGSPVTGEFRCDELRDPGLALTLTDITPYFNSPSAVNYLDLYVIPGAFVPDSATVLCDSGLFGYTRPRTENPVSGAIATTAARYDASFDTYAPGAGGVTWNGAANSRGYYYDRPFMWLCAWARTGDIQYLKTGWAQWARFRTIYLVPNNWGVNEHDLGLRGWAAMFWLFRDILARDKGLKPIATTAVNPGFPRYSQIGDATTTCGVERYASNSLRAIPLALATSVVVTNPWRTFQKALNDPTGPALPATPAWGPVTRQDGTVIPFTSRQEVFFNGTPLLVTVAFQGALMCDAMIVLYDYALVNTVAGVDFSLLLSRIQSDVDTWWDYMRRTTDPAGAGTNISYASASYTAPGGGGFSHSVDLTGFYVWVCYWLAWRLGGSDATTYIARGDELFDAQTRSPFNGTTGPYLAGFDPKQFTENFQLSPQALGLRALALGG